MYCRICGKDVNDQAVICPHCGCQIATPVQTEQTTKPQKKANIFCIIGFVLSLISLILALWGIVAIAGLVLSIIGIIQCSRNGDKLKGLGIAGICVATGSLVYTVYCFVVILAALATL